MGQPSQVVFATVLGLVPLGTDYKPSEPAELKLLNLGAPEPPNPGPVKT